MRIFFFTTIKAGCCCAERKELSLLLHVNKLKIKPQFYFEKLSIRGGVEMGGSMQIFPVVKGSIQIGLVMVFAMGVSI